MKSDSLNFERVDDVIDALENLDLLCEERGIKAEILILGGAGMLILMEQRNHKFRPTRDIDVNIISTNKEEEIKEVLREVNIQIVGGVMDLPPMEDFQGSKKHEIDVGFNAIRAYVPSNEMLACSKIFSKREKDLHDLKYEGFLDSCNPYKLLDMIHVYKPYMVNPLDPDSNVHEIIEILNKRVYK